MEWCEIEVDGQRTIKFPDKALWRPTQSAENLTGLDDASQQLGGIIKRGEWAWLARDCILNIISLRNGQAISNYEFAVQSQPADSCCIKCVEELFPGNSDNTVLLAVCLENFRGGPGGAGRSFVAIYSVEHSRVLSCMELLLHISCARFMNSTNCRRTLLQNFDGCLSVGSEEGFVVLLDLNVRKLLSLCDQQDAPTTHEDILTPCHLVDYNLPLTEIHRKFRQCQQDGVHFALQMEVIDTPCSIQSILPIDLILGLAIGLEDGRLALYDLTELQIFYIAIPQQAQEMSALVKMDFLEPPDDPRPCLYIWAMHDNEEMLTAVLHTLMYEKRLIEDNGLSAFETFQSSSVRLQLPLESTKCLTLSCQSISTVTTHGEDDSNCLCALTWYSELEEKNKLLIFDLNQWYKEEMPFVINWQKHPSYLAGYILNGQYCGLHTYLNPGTIAHFNSIQRFEEHFYPNSLSFDYSLLLKNGCRSYNWEGAQNKVINILRSRNASIFLEPEPYFNEILRTRLMPQFSELNVNSTFSRNAKYETILSVALENNCFSLLRDCAKCWADGSFMGNFTASTGISLSTLTEWIWKRATDIKTRCNDLCKGLFDFGGYPLDQREQKELSFITRQLKLLADLLEEVLTFSKRQIPDKVYASLDSKHKSLHMASEYQDILLWLLNIGLLPEASPYSCKVNPNAELVPYPYAQLKALYSGKRACFNKISDSFILKKTGSCRLIYIDVLIEHECKGNVLHEFWLENNGDGLYPPTSIEAMLRVMLVPEVSFDSKCAILLYFFLDLHMAIDEQAYKNVVANLVKFPSVFRLSASLIKTVQAFWNLDHGHFLPAVDEFISPFNNNQNYPQWLLELLIETLLTQNASNLALRILEARPNLISPVLKLKTLLSNELIAEAFHFARSKHDDSLLELFFKCCLCSGEFGVIRDLALSEKEGQLVQSILKRSKTHGAENLHFVYLLQKSKYIEAVSYMDELSKAKCIRSNFGHPSSQMDTPNLVLSAFNTTMTPVTQGLTDVYFRIKNKIKKKEANNKSPVPLSCQLIKQNANNLLGGIYHSSALSAHFATSYWGDMENQKSETSSSILSSNNAPFLRKPQTETHYLDFLERNALSYPQTYKVSEKRNLTESDLHNTSGTEQVLQQNPIKRRRLMGEEIVNDLSHFMKLNKNSNRLNISDFSFAEPSQKTVPETGDSFLTRPLVKPRLNQVESSGHTIKPLATTEIHSILKTNTPEPTERFGLRKEAPVDEEKNIRFRLPSTELNQEFKTTKTFDVSLKDDEYDEESDIEVIVEIQHEPPEENTKIVARSVSVESSRSSSSSKTPSEENFYSPLSSQNNSIVVDNSRLSANLNVSNLQKTNNEYSFLSGPQPRKPLARLSAERSEKSLTPEPMVTTKLTHSYANESKNVELRESSGFGSFSAKNPSISATSSTCVKSSFQITSVTSLASKINEFSPQVSSSKVGESQSKFTSDKTESHVKLSECSTVIGTLTSIESSLESYKTPFAFPNVRTEKPNTNNLIEENQMLDSTLGMSSYDFTVLDITAPATLQCLQKSSFAKTNDGDAPVELKPVVVEETVELFDDMESNDNIEEDDNSALYNEAMGLPVNHIDDEASNEEFSIYQQTDGTSNPASEKKESDNGVVIVLTSSSSESSNDTINTITEESYNEISESEMDLDDEMQNSDEQDTKNYECDEVESEEEDSFNEESEKDMLNALKDDDYFDDTTCSTKESNETEEKQETEKKKAKDLVEVNYHQDKHNTTNILLGNVPIVGKVSDPEEIKKVEEDTEKKSLQNVQITVVESELIKENKKLSDIRFQVDKEDNVNTNKALQENEKTLVACTSGQKQTSDINTFKLDTSETQKSSPLIELDSGNVDLSLKCIEESTLEVTSSSDHIIKEETEVQIEEDEEEIISLRVEEDDFPVNELTQDESDDHTNILLMETNEATSKITLINKTDKILNKIVVEDKQKSIEETNNKIPDKLSNESVMEDEKKSIDETNNKIPDKISNESAVEDEQKSIEETNNKIPDKISNESVIVDEQNLIDETNNKNPEYRLICNDKKNEECMNKTSEDSKELTKETQSSPSTSSAVLENAGKDQALQIKITLETENVTSKNRSESFGTPVLHKELLKPHETSNITPRRRSARGISVPPQSIPDENESVAVLTPRTHRHIRATSLQPQSTPEIDSEPTGTPQTRRNIRGTSAQPSEIIYETAAKINTRRRSYLLDAITEDAALIDSPSARTRSRARLNSMDSELESSIITTDAEPIQKRTRRISVSSSVSELTQTPKRSRRNSITSQTDTGTPRAVRGRSITVAIEESDALDKTKPVAKKTPLKRKKSTDENPNTATLEEEVEKDKQLGSIEEPKKSRSPRTDTSPSTSYSASRRLTRTQLAMLEKSAAITKEVAARNANKTQISPPAAKRVTKRRTSRSLATPNPDSDDGESISSLISNLSSAVAKRRVTRSSIKDKEEVDDDLASIASSMGSERHSKRRSKEKNSPNSTLTAIPEVESEVPVEPKKRGRPPKH